MIKRVKHNIRRYSRGVFILPLLLIAMVPVACSAPLHADFAVAVRIVNPYDGIDWDSVVRLKANLHTHTTASDGRLCADGKIDEYAQMGYDVIAITDHNRFGVDSTHFRTIGAREVLVIQGIEVSRRRHFNALFTGHTTRGGTTCRRIGCYVENSDAMLFLNHPSRHGGRRFYADIFNRHAADRLVGIEVFNRGGRYRRCVSFWDTILTAHAPYRAVWGFANDDAHRLRHMGLSFNEFLVDVFTAENLRAAMAGGRSFMFNRTAQNSGTLPTITHIDHDGMTLTIAAQDADSIAWISRGEVVSSNFSLDVAALDVRGYVRFTLTNSAGVLYSQPFLLRGK